MRNVFECTRKDVKRIGYNGIVCIPCADLQDLFPKSDRIAYNAGVYGWNYDVYELNYGLALSTGYRPIGNISAPREIVKMYNDAAKRLRNDFSYFSPEYQTGIQNLRDSFAFAASNNFRKDL